MTNDNNNLNLQKQFSPHIPVVETPCEERVISSFEMRTQDQKKSKAHNHTRQSTPVLCSR